MELIATPYTQRIWSILSEEIVIDPLYLVYAFDRDTNVELDNAFNERVTF